MTVVLGPVASIALVLGGRAGLSVELLSIALALAGAAVISLLGTMSDRTGRSVVVALAGNAIMDLSDDQRALLV